MIRQEVHGEPRNEHADRHSVDERRWLAAANLQEAADFLAARDPGIRPPLPEGRELRAYQEAGIAALLRRLGVLEARIPEDIRGGVLLADEMGLGKTAQAIAVCNWLKGAAFPLLIVCPRSVKLVWRNEWQAWSTSGIEPLIIPATPTDEMLSAAKRAPLIVVNYDKFSRAGKLQELLVKRAWSTLILDECHYIKETRSRRSKAILRINATRTIALTGTPMVNRPSELWTQSERVAPSFLGRFPEYAIRYCNAWHEHRFLSNGRRYSALCGTDGSSNLPELRHRMRASVMVRRHKKNVLHELPAKQRLLVCIEPPKAVIAAIDAFEAELSEEGFPMEVLELAFVSGLRSAVPQLTLPRRLIKNLATLRRRLGMAKREAALDLIRDSVSKSGDKIVVFAHHREVIDTIYKSLGAFGRVRIYGKDNDAARKEAVLRFREDPDCRIFLGSIGAAREGITLTAASDVIFVETDWVPGSILQAEDRCHRIGQQSSVTIRWIVWDNTLDAIIAQKIVAKLRDIDTVTGPSVGE